MKKKPDHDDRYLQILKAVAQAWQSRISSSKPATEVAARRRSCRGNPSRFKIEAMRTRWDFVQSLWDSCEVVAVSKRLERGLVLDGDDGDDGGWRSHRRRRRQRCNALRSLFN